MSDQAESFSPIAGAQMHTLILGTIPGQASLKSAEYYAHPRNAFWPIMLAILQKEPPSYELPKSLNYEDRCKLLTMHGFALWDVLASCTRPGSLDSRIIKGSEQANNIASLASSHPELKRIVCNGRTAEKLFARHLLSIMPRPVIHPRGSECPSDPSCANVITLLSLPSTSPAMASLTLADKYQVWADGLLG